MLRRGAPCFTRLQSKRHLGGAHWREHYPCDYERCSSRSRQQDMLLSSPILLCPLSLFSLARFNKWSHQEDLRLAQLVISFLVSEEASTPTQLFSPFQKIDDKQDWAFANPLQGWEGRQQTEWRWSFPQGQMAVEDNTCAPTTGENPVHWLRTHFSPNFSQTTTKNHPRHQFSNYQFWTLTLVLIKVPGIANQCLWAL